ncbi:MAG: hypothetical protein IT436_12250 [Phycisphaerales bacterium]|nr:hypothetical protein [Phycisphaerales bacterium]
MPTPPTTPFHRRAAFLPLAGILAFLCPPALAAPCSPADLNGDGLVDFSDYLDFLTLFDAADPRVDYTGDGLVDFADYLEFLNLYELGCGPVNTELAGNTLQTIPHFEFVQAFNTGAPVSLAISPARLPDLTGRTADVYIVADRSAAQWSANPALADVRPSGPQAITFTSGSITTNRFVLTGSGLLPAGTGESIAARYDLVIDADRDGLLGPGDVGDGLDDQPGFVVLKDLSLDSATPVTLVNANVAPGSVALTYESIRIGYPSDIASRGALPLIIISHGNGHSYTWYDYLLTLFASHGFIALSHENNTGPGIETASQTTLDHTAAIINQQATVAGGVLSGHIDASRIMWIGHSRGGEGVVRAYDRIFDGSFTPSGYTLASIRLVSSIAPTDRLGPANADPHAVNYHLLYGSADGDELAAPCPSSGSSSPFTIFERATGERQSNYVHGADHNDFNCCGFEDFDGPAGTAIGRPEAQRIARSVYLAISKLYLSGDDAGEELRWRQWERFRPVAVSSSSVVVNEYRAAATAPKAILEDYQTQPGLTVSSSGGAVAATVSNLFEGLMRDADCTYEWLPADPMNGMTRAVTGDTSRGAVFDYSLADRAVEFEVPPALRDLSVHGYLSLRACQGTRHPETIAELSDLTFTVTLRDSAGRSSSINIGAYGGGIEEPYQRTGSGAGAGWTNEFETILIRLTDFTHTAPELDLTDITAVRIDLGPSWGSARGRLGLDDIEFIR